MCLCESFLSEIPEKVSESVLSEIVSPKLFRPKVFDFNEDVLLHCRYFQFDFKIHLGFIPIRGYGRSSAEIPFENLPKRVKTTVKISSVFLPNKQGQIL